MVLLEAPYLGKSSNCKLCQINLPAESEKLTLIVKSPSLLGFLTATEQVAEGEAVATPEVVVGATVEIVAVDKVVSVELVGTKGVEDGKTRLEVGDGVNVAIVDGVDVDGGITGTTLMVEIDPVSEEIDGFEGAKVVVLTIVINVVVGGTYEKDSVDKSEPS